MKLPSLNAQILIFAMVGIFRGWLAHGSEQASGLYAANMTGTLFITQNGVNADCDWAHGEQSVKGTGRDNIMAVVMFSLLNGIALVLGGVQ